MKTKEGLWKLSPSGLYGFEDCKSCFWAENHIGRHPFTLPLRLNDAMDNILKHRYDKFRKKGEVPPEISHLRGIKLFKDTEKLEAWRNQPTALAYRNERDGYVLQGKLDEVLVDDKNRLTPADYKSSGDEPGIEKQKYYRLQLHAYALMIKKQGYSVSDRAYLLHYFVKDKTQPSMEVVFDNHVDRVKIDLPAFQKVMREMVEFLNAPLPGANKKCKKCAWVEKRK